MKMFDADKTRMIGLLTRDLLAIAKFCLITNYKTKIREEMSL